MWFIVLRNEWTVERQVLFAAVNELNPESAATIVPQILADPSRSIITPSADRAVLCAAVDNEPALCRRMRTG